MNSEARLRMITGARALAGSFAVFLLASCSGPSTYHNSANPPVAVANVIGAQPTSAAGADPVTVTVRSQSQVILTGNASSGGDAAIGTFAWSQTDSAPTPQAVLLYLDADTVTFTAPTVGADTTLHFTLTVTTAGNAAVTAHAVVLVKAVNDPNQFLAPLAAQHFFKVALATKEGLGPFATPSAVLPADVPVCVTISRTINYLGRDGGQHAVSLPALQASTAWVASIGGAANPSATDFGSYTNPRVAFAIPALNQDDLAVLFNNPIPGESSAATAARLAQQLVASDIDMAHLSLTAAAASGSCDGTLTTTALVNKTLQVQVLDQGGNAVGGAASSPSVGTAAVTASFLPDMLLSQQAGQYETADTARAYYDAIDPGGKKTNLANWLDANCFTSTAANYGASAHSVYTNNFDLGFGRDMYFASCTAASPAVISGLAKVGDMAAVVLNYASLEAAASKLNPIQAVAMEYSAATDGSYPARRFPKFYIFAPNDRDGTFQRVLSANFDHRGEKYLPGTCVVCHGGTLPVFPKHFVHVASTDPKYVAVADPTKQQPLLGLADIDTTFMPWDLDSFLYSSAPQQVNTDPSFVGLSVSASLYTRSAQEPNLKQLNQLAYCTYQPEIESVNSVNVDRFAGSRQLVAQWYAGSGQPDAGCPATGQPTAALLPNSSYSDAGTPALWTAQSAPAMTTLTSDMIYHQVLARECRACHTQNAAIAQQFTDYPSFIKFFEPANSALGLGVQYAFRQGRMPMARLTMDRFWVDYAGGDSAAKTLATHIQQVNANAAGQPKLLDSSGNAIGPGIPPIVNVTVNGSLASAGGPSLTVTRYTGASADALAMASASIAPSFFIASYQWSLCLVPTAGGSCATQPLVGGTSALPGFATNASGTYQLSLAADNGFGASTTPQFNLLVKQTPPTLTATCPAAVNAPVLSMTAVNLGPTSTGGDNCIVPGDGSNMLQIQDPSTMAWVAPTSGAPLSTSVWSASVSGYTLTFEYLMAPITPVSLNYRVVDADGLTAGAGVEFVYLTHLNNLSFPIHLNNPLGVAPAADNTGNFALSTATLLQGVPAVEVSSLTIASNPTLGGVSPASIAPSGQFIYAVPTSNPVMCDVNGQSISNINNACSGDPFTYYATVSGSNLNTATITMQVLATTSFWQSTSGASTGIYGILGGTQCATCHDPTSGSTQAAATIHWKYSSGGTLASDSLATWNSVTSTVTSPTIIVPGTPSSSYLYLNPCTGDAMDFGRRSLQLAAQHEALRCRGGYRTLGRP
jgi:mono/diheme cytochrome c family protein